MDKINEVKNKLDERAGNPHLGMERQVALDALNVITEQESEIARLRVDLSVERNTVSMLRVSLSAAQKASENSEMSAKCSRTLKEKAESENLELLEKCRRLEFANEQLRLKLNAHRDGIVKLSAERDEKNKAFEDLKKENETLLKVAADAKSETDKFRFLTDQWHKRYIDVCGTKEMLIKTNNGLVQARDSLREKLQSTEEQLHKMTDKAAMAAYAMTEANTLARKDGSRIFTYLEHCPSCRQCIQVSFVVPEKEKQTVNVLFRDGKRKYGLCPTCERSVDSEENATACGRCGTPLDWGENDATKGCT